MNASTIPSFVLDMAQFMNKLSKHEIDSLTTDSYSMFVKELRNEILFAQYVVDTMYKNVRVTMTKLKKHEQAYFAFKVAYNQMLKNAPLVQNFDADGKLNDADQKYADYIATLDAQIKEELALIEQIQDLIVEKLKVVQESDFIRNVELEQFVSK